MKRGEVYWVNEFSAKGGEIKKRRPWVIVGANGLNRSRKTVVAIPLSTSPDPSPIAVQVNNGGNLVVAVCDQIRAISKDYFDSNSSNALSNGDMELIEEGLRKVLVL